MLVERDRHKRRIYLSQGAYIKHVLTRFKMEDSKGCPTPMDPKSKLRNRLAEEQVTEKHQYQEAVGCLTYAAITTRPDIAYASALGGRLGRPIYSALGSSSENLTLSARDAGTTATTWERRKWSDWGSTQALQYCTNDGIYRCRLRRRG